MRNPITGRRISTNYVSEYSLYVYNHPEFSKKVKQVEDLTESVMRYLDPDDTDFVKDSPNRAEYIKKLLGVEPGENQTYRR